MKPRILILKASGTNRDGDAAAAFVQAGGEPVIQPLAVLRSSRAKWRDYDILVIPGGFSYADALGAGRLLALDLTTYFNDQVQDFVSSSRPVIGICNGFQALVKSGILPGWTAADGAPAATLTFNQSGRFECRWVALKPVSRHCLWTRDLETVACPVAHGEGRFVVRDGQAEAKLEANDQIALVYATAGSSGVASTVSAAGGAYPANPNGSIRDIAGICNPAGNVLGLMPHPEDYIFPTRHPNWTRGGAQGSGLALFQNGVKFAREA
ncbi:MAG TPA: phosphoribosylformylglycinamidine synthase I [Anaerolineaceae bacterium]|nr:phosphoribosylformylglycinamidine synthase I [Anaerolineaceae bacterium]